MDRRALLPAGLILIVLVACGGGDNGNGGDGGDRGSVDFKKQEFAAAAEEICTEITNAGKLITGNSRHEDVANGLDRFIAVLRSSVRRLKTVELPDGEAGDLAEEYVGAWETDVEKVLPAIVDVRAAFNANDRQAFQEAARRFRDIEPTDKEALERELDIVNC